MIPPAGWRRSRPTTTVKKSVRSDGFAALAGHRRGGQATNFSELYARRIISAQTRAITMRIDADQPTFLSGTVVLRSHHLRQIRTPCRALVAHIASLPLRTVGGDLGEPINHLGVTSALLDQTTPKKKPQRVRFHVTKAGRPSPTCATRSGLRADPRTC